LSLNQYASNNVRENDKQNSALTMEENWLFLFSRLLFIYDNNIVRGDIVANKKGDRFECEECGLVILVENPCCCSASCKITCCGKPLKLI
jgi:hypothetical protein